MNPRVAVLGDSVISGYGVGGRSYANLLAERLESERIMSYARSTFTVLDEVRLLDRVETFDPDLVLVNAGGSEALVHAGAAVERLLERFAPKSWRGVEGLEPKPQAAAGASITKARRRVTGLVKLLVKHIGIRLTGGYRRVQPGVFEEAFAAIMQRLSGLECVVLVIGLHTPDEFLWPRTTASATEYEAAVTRVLASHPDVIFFDPKPELHQWNDFIDDHVHFNERGHAKVAAGIWQLLAVDAAWQHRPDEQLRPEGSDLSVRKHQA